MKILKYMLLLFPLGLWGQDVASIVAEAEQLDQAGKTEAANTKWEMAAGLYEKSSDWANYLDCGLHISNNQLAIGELDNAINTAETYIAKGEAQLKEPVIALSLLYKNIGRAYYPQQQFKLALKAMEKALKIREEIDPKDAELARDYGNVGIISGITDRSQKAIKYLEEAIKINNNANVLITLLITLANNQRSLGNYNEALENINEAILLDTNKEYEDQTSMAKAKVLFALEKYKEGFKFAKKAIKLFKEKEDFINYRISIGMLSNAYLNYSGINDDKSLIDSALHYADLSYQVSVDNFEEGSLDQLASTLTLASLYIETNQLDKANTLLNKVKDLSSLKDYPIQEQAFYETSAKLAIKQGDYDKALKYTQQQLIVLIEDYKNEDPYDLPDLEMAKKAFSLDNLTDALAIKARYFYNYYKSEKQDKKLLEAGLANIELYDQVVAHLRSQLSGDKYRWGDITLDAYENAIEICLALSEATGDAQYQEKAFYYAEKSKSLSLLESFQNSKAKNTSGLPIEELEKAQELELDISDLEQEIFQLEQKKEKDQSKLDALKKERFAKIQDRDAFIERLEKEYPKYYEMKYGSSFMTVADVQKLLEEDQAFLEYFVGDDGVYVFKVTASNLEVFSLGKLPNLSKDVMDFRSSIYGYYLYSSDRSEQTYGKYATEYAGYAFALYEKLIKPIGALPKRLIIIPAGPLGNMPFEPLLTKAPDDPKQFKMHAYLIKDHMISYCYSATLLREMKNRQHKEVKGKYLAFAPKFGESSESIIRGERFALAPLAFNTTEVEKISEFLGFGTVLKGDEATEAAFKEKGGDYKVIHFATHGMANDEHPDFSLLAFTEIPDSIENEFLYVRDLYNMELNADMVVLSACETGLGEMRKAEGVISLARGFSYAGAKSIFTTLWSVNDQATYRIVEGFYKQLKAGKTKDEALHLAKVDFIESSNNLTAHPFLWSPYVLVGDMSPIEALKEGFPWIYMAIGGGVLLLAFLGFGAMRMKRKKEW